MITIIIFGIIGAVLGVISFGGCYYGYDIEDLILDTMVAFFSFIIGALFGLLVAIGLPAKTEPVKYSYKLEALQDNGSLNGAFFLGSGRVGGVMKYVFYYEKDGYYKLGQINCDDAVVRYSDDTPRIESIVEEPFKGSFINYFAIDTYLHKFYVIYVPKGTINNNYSLDAK